MKTKYFVEKNNIVRRIWGKADTILFIFAGASAEFALSKAVDWLYFTGRLPTDPLERLFSTVSYAKVIVFAKEINAYQAIDRMNEIHASIEKNRGFKIPQWAYRDVLFMLIDYSIRAYEVLERPLTEFEKREVFNVFYRVGKRMHIEGLALDFDAWQVQRKKQLDENFQYSRYTKDLFIQYEKHLGTFRFHLLKSVQSIILPHTLKNLLHLRTKSFMNGIISLYKLCTLIYADHLLKEFLLPKAYKNQIKSLDHSIYLSK